MQAGHIKVQVQVKVSRTRSSSPTPSADYTPLRQDPSTPNLTFARSQSKQPSRLTTRFDDHGLRNR